MHYLKNGIEEVAKPPPIPQHYWEDAQWASEQACELQERFSGQWIAVYYKEVVASGKVLAEVERMAQEKTGEKEIFIRFVETGRKVYTPRAND
jgi:hypothetical protein